MPDVIIPDTSCLIFLHKIEQINLLQQLYEKTIVTPDIVSEFDSPLMDWIEIKDPKDKQYQKVLEQKIDKGEASIIALAMDIKNCVISLDDLKARKTAKSLGLTITGTLGILSNAKNKGQIKSIKVMIKKLKAVDFRISKKIEKELLRLSGE